MAFGGKMRAGYQVLNKNTNTLRPVVVGFSDGYLDNNGMLHHINDTKTSQLKSLLPAEWAAILNK